jgi:hypothetical protein
MKLGAENRTTAMVAVALMVIAAFMIVRMWSGGSQPAVAANPSPVVQPDTTAATPTPARVRRPARPGHGNNPRNAPAGSVVTLDPRLRLDLLKLSEETEYKGAGRNIFRAEAEIPKPIEPPIKKAEVTPPPPQPTGPPPPPPINLKFVGFASGKGEPTKVFLSQGDDIFVAAEGEIVNRRYKVMRIFPNSVEIEDVLSNNRQTIPLTAG